MASGKPGHRLHGRPVRHGAGGIVGADQQNRLGFLGDDPLNILCPDLKTILGIGGAGHHFAAGQGNAGIVRRIPGLRHNHFVPRVQNALHRQENRLLRAHCNQDIRIGIASNPIRLELLRHGPPQLRQARPRRIVGHVLVQALFRGLHNIPRRLQVGITAAQIDHVVHCGRQRQHFPAVIRRPVMLQPVRQKSFRSHISASAFLNSARGSPAS